MSNLFWLTDAQMVRLQPFFPKSRGKPRVDDRRALRGIIFINRHGLRWCEAPREYGPPKTLDNSWRRLSNKGAFALMKDGLAAEGAVLKTVMIDAIYLKARHTVTNRRSKMGGQATREAVDSALNFDKIIRGINIWVSPNVVYVHHQGFDGSACRIWRQMIEAQGHKGFQNSQDRSGLALSLACT
jgi:transposase